MQGMGEGGENCPFEFNFDPATFKPGDEVSYRVTGSLEGFPCCHCRRCQRPRRPLQGNTRKPSAR
jgi:hypothetical protein